MSRANVARFGGCLVLTVVFGITSNPSASSADARADPAEFRVVGYLPDYRTDAFAPAMAAGVTDLLLFSAEPTADGTLDLRRLKDVAWPSLTDFKTRHRVRLILSVGGWGRSAGFGAVATSAEKRRTFAASAVRTCLERRLDGLDLDWEHPQDVDEEQGYGELLAALREAFRPHGLALSMTVAGWQTVPPKAAAAVDTVNVMAYDQDGRHSTFDGAASDVDRLLKQGVPKAKIVLGLPFYGRSLENRDRTLTYREIVAKHRPESDVDEVDGLYFNGPSTIQRKTAWAREQGLAGVMIWELGQDAEGDKSLLRAIRETLGR